MYIILCAFLVQSLFDIMNYYRSSPPQPIDFKFDESLLCDYKGPLKANQLALDDMTFDPLKEKYILFIYMTFNNFGKFSSTL